MAGNQAFLVVAARPLDAGRWLVEGRAYEDIYVGDLLFADAALSSGTGECPRFTVLSITTYRREVSVLSAIVTGALVLGGEHGDCLREAKMPYRAPVADAAAGGR